jgi:hypothetical protein
MANCDDDLLWGVIALLARLAQFDMACAAYSREKLPVDRYRE